MDRPGADYERCMDMMRSRLTRIQFRFSTPWAKKRRIQGSSRPFGLEGDHYRDETLGAEYAVEEIPAEYKDIVHQYREKIIEALRSDEKGFEKFVGGERSQ
jgi:elongation factor G